MAGAEPAPDISLPWDPSGECGLPGGRVGLRTLLRREPVAKHVVVDAVRDKSGGRRGSQQVATGLDIAGHPRAALIPTSQHHDLARRVVDGSEDGTRVDR